MRHGSRHGDDPGAALASGSSRPVGPGRKASGPWWTPPGPSANGFTTDPVACQRSTAILGSAPQRVRQAGDPLPSAAGRRASELRLRADPELGRLPALTTLLLAGPRVSELCQLDESQVDLAARRIRIPRVKTDVSERTVPMVPGLHETFLPPGPRGKRTAGPPSQRAMARTSIPTTSARDWSHLYGSARTSCSPSATSP